MDYKVVDLSGRTFDPKGLTIHCGGRITGFNPTVSSFLGSYGKIKREILEKIQVDLHDQDLGEMSPAAFARRLPKNTFRREVTEDAILIWGVFIPKADAITIARYRHGGKKRGIGEEFNKPNILSLEDFMAERGKIFENRFPLVESLGNINFSPYNGYITAVQYGTEKLGFFGLSKKVREYIEKISEDAENNLRNSEVIDITTRKPLSMITTT